LSFPLSRSFRLSVVHCGGCLLLFVFIVGVLPRRSALLPFIFVVGVLSHHSVLLLFVIVPCCRESCSCHVADGDVAPGSHVRKGGGSGVWHCPVVCHRCVHHSVAMSWCCIALASWSPCCTTLAAWSPCPGCIMHVIATVSWPHDGLGKVSKETTTTNDVVVHRLVAMSLMVTWHLFGVKRGAQRAVMLTYLAWAQPRHHQTKWHIR
jgi:hypothetical protein